MLTRSVPHSLIHFLYTCWTTFVFMSMLKSHSLTLTLCLTLTLSLSHSLTLHMLNNFCFHVYAEKSHSHTLSHSRIHSLSTCWTTFVFMSRLKNLCLWPKIAMVFLTATSREFRMAHIKMAVYGKWVTSGNIMWEGVTGWDSRSVSKNNHYLDKNR